EPAVRVGGEVGVVAEDALDADVLAELDEPARPADEDTQGIEGLHPIELVGSEEALAERGHPEIDEQELERRAARPARTWSHQASSCGRQRAEYRSIGGAAPPRAPAPLTPETRNPQAPRLAQTQSNTATRI